MLFLSHLCYNMISRSKSRSSLHDKIFELGPRQTFESNDLHSKSAAFECLRIMGVASKSVTYQKIMKGNSYERNFQLFY